MGIPFSPFMEFDYAQKIRSSVKPAFRVRPDCFVMRAGRCCLGTAASADLSRTDLHMNGLNSAKERFSLNFRITLHPQ